MPISSTEVANIIAQQNHAFAMANYSAMSITQKHLQPPEPPAAVNADIGGGIGAYAGQAPALAAGALSFGAMMGVAPRIFDPFTTGMHAAAGAGGFKNLPAAMGMGIAGFGMASGLAAGIDMAAGSVTYGAQQRAALNSQISTVMPQAPMAQIGNISGAVEGMARSGIGSINELTSIMGGAHSAGDLNMGSIGEFQASFSRLVSSARQIANTLQSSVTEGYAALQQVRSLGVGIGDAPGVVGAMKNIGAASGMSPEAMFGAAAEGAAFGKATGIGKMAGIYGGMTNAAVMNMAGASLDIGPQDAAAYQGAAARFFSSRQGMKVLGAAYDPATGDLNSSVASQIASGAMSSEEIARLYSKNTAGGRDAFMARQSELAGQFMNEHGAQGIAAPLREMTRGSANPEQMMQQLSGLGRADIQMMESLSAATPYLKQKLMQEARAGFQEGQNSSALTQVSKAIDEFVQPLRDKFRAFGAGITQSVSEAVEAVGMEFSRAPPGVPNPRGARAAISAYATGNQAEIQSFQNAMQYAGGGDYYTRGLPQETENTGIARQWLPGIARMGTMSPGTSIGDLPMYGMALGEYNETMAMGSYGMVGAAGLRAVTGANPLSWPGRGIDAMGRATRMLAGSGGGFTGRGLIGGSLAATGYGIQGVGKTLSGLGRLASNPWVAGAALAVNLGMNVLPDKLREEGVIEGEGVTGDSARYMRDLNEWGFLENEESGDISVTGIGKTLRTSRSGYSRAVGELFSGGDDLENLIDTTAGLGGRKHYQRRVRDVAVKADARENVRAIAAEFKVTEKQAAQLLAKAGGIANPGDVATSADPMKALSAGLAAKLGDRGLNFADAEKDPMAFMGKLFGGGGKQQLSELLAKDDGTLSSVLSGIGAELRSTGVERLDGLSKVQLIEERLAGHITDPVKRKAIASALLSEGTGADSTLGSAADVSKFAGTATQLRHMRGRARGESGSMELSYQFSRMGVGSSGFRDAWGKFEEDLESNSMSDEAGIIAGAKSFGDTENALSRELAARKLSESELTEVATTLSRGNTLAEQTMYGVVLGEQQFSRAIRQGGGGALRDARGGKVNRGLNKEKFIESVTGHDLKLGTRDKKALDNTGVAATSRLQSELREAARQFYMSRGMAPEQIDTAMLNEGMDALGLAADAAKSGDYDKARQLMRKLSSKVAPMGAEHGAPTGTMMKDAEEFATVLKSVTKALVAARDQISQ